jgi:hypothetical protein
MAFKESFLNSPKIEKNTKEPINIDAIATEKFLNSSKAKEPINTDEVTAENFSNSSKIEEKTKEPIKRFTIELPLGAHKKLKWLAIDTNQKMKEIALNIILEYLEKYSGKQ